jgi:hypothetical protein
MCTVHINVRIDYFETNSERDTKVKQDSITVKWDIMLYALERMLCSEGRGCMILLCSPLGTVLFKFSKLGLVDSVI